MESLKDKELINYSVREPKEIFLTYCACIGDHFTKDNFKFFKARPRLERKSGEFIESINFWSSVSNAKGEYVNLEILPYIKSNQLKKWINVNKIGRNEFIYALKIDFPRNINIYGHSQNDFEELMVQIEKQIIRKLQEVELALFDLEGFLKSYTKEYGLIKDNFLAYVFMVEPKLIDLALEKFAGDLSDSFNSDVQMKIKNGF